MDGSCGRGKYGELIKHECKHNSRHDLGRVGAMPRSHLTEYIEINDHSFHFKCKGSYIDLKLVT